MKMQMAGRTARCRIKTRKREHTPPLQRIDKVRFVDVEGGQRLKFCGISGRRWVESTDSSGFAYGICANPPYMPLDLI